MCKDDWETHHESFAVVTGKTLSECNDLCNTNPTCQWFHWEIDHCSGATTFCTGDKAWTGNSYRPTNFVEPSLTVDACTHKEWSSKDTAKVTLCPTFTAIADCKADANCDWIITPTIAAA
jgi:hypothetical protein